MRRTLGWAVVVVAAGMLTAPVAVWADAGNTNSTIDGVAWSDANSDGVRGPGENGVDGIEVQLLEPTGAVIGRTTTATVDGQAGYYSFVPPSIPAANLVRVVGTYDLQITTPDAGSDPAADSDVNQASGTSGLQECDHDGCTGESDAGLAPRRADVSLTARPAEVRFPAGGDAVLALDYANPGNVVKPGADISATVPAGLTAEARPIPGWTCAFPEPANLVCSSEHSLVPGQSVTPVEVVLRADATLTASMEFGTLGFYRDPTENPADNYSTVKVTVTAP